MVRLFVFYKRKPSLYKIPKLDFKDAEKSPATKPVRRVFVPPIDNWNFIDFKSFLAMSLPGLSMDFLKKMSAG